MGNQNTNSLSDKNVGFLTNTTEMKLEKPKDKNETRTPVNNSPHNFKLITSDNLTTNDNFDFNMSNDTSSVITGTNREQKQDTCDEKVPTLFQWREGGKVVYVSGNFSNWTHLFIMEKKENGIFELILDLPKGVYQYKFIVDNQWKYSLQQPTCKDSKGNVNNIVEACSSEKEKFESNKSPNDEKTIRPENIRKSLTDEYSQYIPSKNDLNMEAPNVPHHYSVPFNLDYNTHQFLIGNNEFINIKERNNYNANTSNKTILNSPHVNL